LYLSVWVIKITGDLSEDLLILNKIKKYLFWNKQKKKFSEWCDKTDHIILKIAFFYIYYPLLFFVKYMKWKYNHIKYDDKKTKKYLDIAIPKAIMHIPIFKDTKFCHPEDYFMVSNCYEFTLECFNFEDIFFTVHGKKKAYFEKFRDESIDFFVNDYVIDGYDKMKILSREDWVYAKSVYHQIKEIPGRIDDLGSVIFMKQRAAQFKRSSNEVPNK